ncbi:MAG: prepilin peptidase [Candidatus Peribacteria bacterium]|nr:MAG: prepilin peptidase [Candidatus Peribacteria bacterium]
MLIERLADDRSRKNIRSMLIGRSVCLSCSGHRELQRYELIPIVSWIRQ